MALSGEVGELTEIFQWLSDDESKNLSDQDLQLAKEEIADIFIYLLRLSTKLNINLEDAGGNYQALEKQKKASTEKSQVYSTKEKNYIRRYYLWELIDTFYKGAKDKMDVFWDLYEKFFRYKDTT